LQRISIIDVSKAGIAFLATNLRPILSRAIIPVAGSWIVLYLSLSAYLDELENLLRTGNDHVAGLVLGAATLGFLVFLLFHSILRTSLAALALGRETYTPWLSLQFARREWRLYSANLRGLVLNLPLVVAVEMAGNVLGAAFPQFALLWGALSVVAILLGLVAIEAMFFLLAPAVTILEKGQILRRSRRISNAAFGKLSVVVVIMLIPGILLENAGELVTRLAGYAQLNTTVSTLPEAVAAFRTILPELLALLVVPYVVTVALLTGAGMRAYRVLVSPKP